MTTEWIVIALVTVPAAAGWYFLLRHAFRAYLERQEERQRIWLRDLNADLVRDQIQRHRTRYQQKRELRVIHSPTVLRRSNAELVTLGPDGPRAA